MEASIFKSPNQEDSLRTLEESAIVERVARIVASVRGTKPDYTRLAAELEQAIPFDVFGVVLLRHDRQAVRVIVCSRAVVYSPGVGEGHTAWNSTDTRRNLARWHMTYHQHPLKDSMLAQIMQAPMLITKDYPDGLYGLPAECGDALSGYPQLHSTLIIPLKVEDRVLGTLELGCIAGGIYANKNRQRLVEAVAPVIATAIEGAQSGGSAKIQDRQRQALKDVSTALTEKVDRATILHRIVVGIAQSLNVSSAIVTMDTTDGHLHLETQEGLQREALEKILNDFYPVHDRCIIGYTFLYRQSCVSQDIATDERFPASAILFAQLGIRSIYCYPLLSGSAIYGILMLCSPETGGFTPLKVDILSLFAGQATIAYHNSLLLEAVQQRNRFQEIIERLERATDDEERLVDGSSTEMLKLLYQVGEESQRVFGVSFATLMRLISEHLLTRGERDLLRVHFADAQVQKYQSKQGTEYPGSAQTGTNAAASTGSLDETLVWLKRRTETALMRAGMLGELSELLMQLKESTGGVKDAWFVTDPDGMCIYMNPAAESFSGIPMAEIEGYPPLTLERIFAALLPRIRNVAEVQHYLRDIAHGNSFPQTVHCILAAQSAVSPLLPEENPQETSEKHEVLPDLAEQQTTTNKIVNRRRYSLRQSDTPSDRYYQLARYPLYDRQGQQIGCALQVSDVTEQVREGKNRSLLLSAVSHDLRTPLTTIKTAVTGLLQEGIEWSEQDQRAILADIDVETDHLTVLVNDLVELSRIEMGALVLEKEWCDVVEVVNGAISKTWRNRAGRPVLLYTLPHLPPVFIDHAQMERAFIYLIENAARSSPPQGKIFIIIDIVSSDALENTPVMGVPSAQRGSILSQWLHVRVMDQRESAPKQERNSIFQSFYSVHTDGKELGLAICKGIVEAHQGHIWVESVPVRVEVAGQIVSFEYATEGVGACFAFVLPAYSYGIPTVSDGTTQQRRTSRATSQAEEE
jgi:signal transduction histidine kinase/GAF domain-containing protein